jgi:hypothetical protein
MDMPTVIHQAYFLPWLGYFAKLRWASTFIVLDDVQFEKRFYHSRTQIIDMHGNVAWIGLPVGENFRSPCNNVTLAHKHSACVERIVKTICQSYAKAHHFECEMPWIEQMLHTSIVAGRTIIDVNLEILVNIMAHLGMEIPKIFRSSTFAADCDRTRRIIDLCNRTDTRELIIGMGSSQVVHDCAQIDGAGIRVAIQDFLSRHPVYGQTRRRHAAFQSGLSIIDVVLNVGSQQAHDFISDRKYSPVFIERL